MFRLNILLALVVLVLYTSSCGGSLGTEFAPTAAGRDSEIGLDSRTSGTGFPSLPADVSGEPSRGASAVVEIGGHEALEFSGGTIEDTNLVLDGGIEANTGMSWALYSFSGLAGKRATSISVNVLPGTDGFGSEYSVGVGNYSEGVWDWLEGGTLDGFDYDLTLEQSRLVSQLGNFYFLVVVEAGHSITIDGATLTSEDETPDNQSLPAKVGRPSVSEGLPDSIEISWRAAAGAEQYELWRRMDDPDGPWELLATQTELAYTDTAIELSQEYKYRVRGENFAGFGGYSRERSGFAGDPPVGFDEFNDEDISIEGLVAAVDATSITIGSFTAEIIDSTIIEFDDGITELVAGVFAKIDADNNGTGGWIATEIEVEAIDEDELRVEGPIDALGEMNLTVGGFTIDVDGSTEIRLQDGDGSFADLALGMYVEVRAEPGGSGWLAYRIDIEGAGGGGI